MRRTNIVLILCSIFVLLLSSCQTGKEEETETTPTQTASVVETEKESPTKETMVVIEDSAIEEIIPEETEEPEALSWAGEDSGMSYESVFDENGFVKAETGLSQEQLEAIKLQISDYDAFDWTRIGYEEADFQKLIDRHVTLTFNSIATADMVIRNGDNVKIRITRNEPDENGNLIADEQTVQANSKGKDLESAVIGHLVGDIFAVGEEDDLKQIQILENDRIAKLSKDDVVNHYTEKLEEQFGKTMHTLKDLTTVIQNKLIESSQESRTRLVLADLEFENIPDAFLSAAVLIRREDDFLSDDAAFSEYLKENGITEEIYRDNCRSLASQLMVCQEIASISKYIPSDYSVADTQWKKDGYYSDVRIKNKLIETFAIKWLYS